MLEIVEMRENLLKLEKLSFHKRVYESIFSQIIFSIIIFIGGFYLNLFIQSVILGCVLILKLIWLNARRNKTYIYQIDRTSNKITIQFLYKDIEKQLEIDLQSFAFEKDLLWYSYPIRYYIKIKDGNLEKLRQYFCGEWSEIMSDKVLVALKNVNK